MIYVLVGPTGSGKTSIATRLSDYLNNAPIVSCDAFQIYKDMNIGTAKIEKDSKYYNRHYLIDIKNPDENYSVMEYQKDFREVIEKLSKEYKDIVVCGGTGLYLRAAIYDYVFNEEDVDISDLEELSNEELYKMLLNIDKEAAKNIHINNRKRVIRAIAISRNNKGNKSEIISNQKHETIYKDLKIFFLNPSREILYENINKRVDKMVEKGLLYETKQLLDNYSLSLTAKQGIGYKEMIDYIEGRSSLEDAIELIKKRSRNYAKRQVTFFKHQFETIEINSYEDLLKNI